MFCRKCANCLTWNISVYLQPSHTGNNIPVPVVFISSFWFFIDNNYYYLCFFLCLDLLQGYENDLVNEDYLLSALDGVDMDSLPGYTVTQIPPGQLPGYTVTQILPGQLPGYTVKQILPGQLPGYTVTQIPPGQLPGYTVTLSHSLLGKLSYFHVPYLQRRPWIRIWIRARYFLTLSEK